MENIRDYRKPIILFLGIALLFFPFSLFSQTSTVTSTVNISVIATVPGEIPPPPPPTGVISAPLPTKIVFEGKAFPSAYLTLLKNGEVAATFLARSSGLFEKELTGLRGGKYNFSIFAEDTEGRKSVTLSFTVTIIEGTTITISEIFIPPTIEISPSRVKRGDTVNIFGQVFPGSKVYIFISPKEGAKEIIASPQGKWSLKLDTTLLEIGEYKVKARAFFGEGEQSGFSEEIIFEVAIICKGADLNFDGKINVFDFSILLHWWETRNPSNPCVDINFDKIIDVIDFSIMMYYWTD